ncbi:component of SCAR regulatory complex [Tieghemostelium lacteum]|uniref:Component of SCAR regulatory complex n=1 Tax=Tieghemostelium lacteum TaxID=361077 RepID=A0A151ZJM1_TIELA|nr:component of SCAR regulatory complex [Tieghemostelium lacteum]|eukprot:KYQ94146.1 component of SCAR regulatory complex [Tieghemostelium lacteum]
MSETPQQPLDMNNLSEITIPNALNELMENHSKMKQISTYCKTAYVSGADTAQIYEQTQSYAKNALLNVAYHIQNIGSHISTLLDLQSQEIKKITSEIQSLTQKSAMIHDISGTNLFQAPDAAKSYKSALKERKIEGSDSAKLPTKFVRKQVNYAMGTEMQLNHSSSSASLSGSSNIPPPPSSSQSLSGSVNSNSSTPTYQSPTYSPQPQPSMAKGKPPPPSLSVPPTIPRPPSTAFDLPPPLSTNGLPPPPVSNLPPPPSVSHLPPPPSTYDLPPPPMRPISHYGYDLSDLPPPPPPQ